MCVCVSLSKQSDKAFLFPRAHINYIYLYIYIHAHTHKARTPCPILGGSPFSSARCCCLLHNVHSLHGFSMHRNRGSTVSQSLLKCTKKKKATKTHTCNVFFPLHKESSYTNSSNICASGFKGKKKVRIKGIIKRLALSITKSPNNCTNTGQTERVCSTL